jgi:adenine-specific DNA-methyltransferase
MAAINDLIRQITDPDLRDRIQKEVNKLNKQKKFGLVFEEHLPECTPLYDIPVRRGVKASLKTGDVSDFYQVLKVEDGKALCIKRGETEAVEFLADDLVTIAEFGEPIYPYLKPIDTVNNAPDSDLWHTLIEADNYHALQLLEYLYAGKVDCIYIDPPYNTGARDWKYNNDYVDSGDTYRHSKWLSMMQRRLQIAKRLLSKDGVMVIAIDDYEEAHLIMLLEDIYPDYDISPVVVNHHPQGGAADNISRTHEYAIFVTPKGKKVVHGKKTENLEENWSLTRGGTDVRNLRKGRPNSFFAIYVRKDTLQVIGVGPHLDVDTPYDPKEAPEGCIAFYPVGKDGTERVWRYERESMQQHIEDGDIVCTPKMTLNVVKQRDVKYDPVFSVWTDGRYNAGTYGTNITYELFGGQNRFSYPKSLYTVADCVGFSIQDKPDALVLDFFAGSGTTLHAVNLLNKEDNGHRRCILVTNNEVSDLEAKALTLQGFKPGDKEWEDLGIAKHITWPRTVCSIEGHDINGKPLKGNYLGSSFPMSDGFKANAAFFKLSFLEKTTIALGMQFKEMLPVLWMKAGCIGKCPELPDGQNPDMLILPENEFAVLLNEQAFAIFEKALEEHSEIQTVFLATDYEVNYRSMVKNLDIEHAYQLYRDYIDHFRLSGGRS